MLKGQAFSSNQLESFTNVLSSIEFKPSLLGKEPAFSFIPTLITFLCSQDTSLDAISDITTDCLLGILDQYISSVLPLASHNLLKIWKTLVTICSSTAERHPSSGVEFDRTLKQIGQISETLQTLSSMPSSPAFYLKSLTTSMLKSVPKSYLSCMLTSISDLCSQAVTDKEVVSKLVFLLESLQTVQMEGSDLPVLLELIYKMGKSMGEEGTAEMGEMVGLAVGLAVGLVGKRFSNL
jgi:hypothetical protein